MPSNDNYRTCICKHITPLDTRCPILRHFEPFWAVFPGQLGSCRAILSNFFGQVWVTSSNSERFLETRYSIVDLGQFSTCLNWGCFETFYAEKSAWSKPHGLDPKKRSVFFIWYSQIIFLYVWDGLEPISEHPPLCLWGATCRQNCASTAWVLEGKWQMLCHTSLGLYYIHLHNPA